MRKIAVLLSVALSLVLMTQTQADCLIRKLPKDGAWACFYCTEESDHGIKRSWYITLKSVGSVTVDERPCRWIEVKYQSDEDRQKGTGTVWWKFLIPEKELGPDGDPLNHVVKAWRKLPGQEPTRPDLAGAMPRLYLLLPPALKEVKQVKERQQFDWQQGRLTSEVVLEATARHVHPGVIVQTRYRLAIHEQVPFGVAGKKLELDEKERESKNGYKATVEYRLVDMGMEATSELADAN